MPVYTLKVEGPESALEAGADAVLQQVWPVMEYLSAGSSHPWEIYLHPLRVDPAFVAVEPGALHFHFHDQGGEVTFYDSVCARWFALTVAALSDPLTWGLSELRLTLVDLPPLQEVLDQPHYRVMRWGTALAEIDAYGDEVILMADGLYETLDGPDADRARALAADSTTEDPVECTLRPTDAVRANLLASLRGAHGDALKSLAWVIGLVASPGELTAALLQRAVDAPDAVSVAIRRLGDRADIALDIQQGLADPESAVRRAALAAVVPLVQHGRVPAAEATRWLMAALERSVPEQIVAAEALGQIDPGEARAAVVVRLCAATGDASEVEHSAVLALFNLHRAQTVPCEVRDVFTQVASRPGPAQKLAEIVLNMGRS